jgi:UDP-glucose 4-epimerase
MTRYLVTGGAGFIGSNLVEALLARGDAVTVLDDLSSGQERNLASLQGKLDVRHGSICKDDDVAKAVRDCSGVFHLAAIPSVGASVADPVRSDEVNVHGTVRVLEHARKAGIARVVYAASSAAYGDSPELPKRESMTPSPMSPYAVGKLTGEYYLRVFAELYGMQTLSLRYFNVYGPRQDPKSEYAAVIPKFIASLLRGEPPIVFGDGLQTRDFCFVGDVVAANMSAMSAKTARGQVVNIGGGSRITLLQLIESLQTVLGVRVQPAFAEARAGDIRHSVADVSLARELLDFDPVTSLESGLRKTADYYQSQ